MLNRSTFLSLLVAVSGAITATASPDVTVLHLNSPEYEREAGRLRGAPPAQYDFTKALLADVLGFLAKDSGISFFSLPEDSAEGQRLITFNIKSSPFQVLETLCKANGLALVPDNGIWYIRPADDRELIGKSYAVRHNALEHVEKMSTMALPLSPMTGGSSGGGGGGGVDLQGPKEAFAVQRSEFINSIRAILDLEREDENGGAGAGAPASPLAGLGAGSGDANAQAQASNSNELSAFRKPKVLWMSDSNTLYVVATRLQHMWVEGYLEAADKPQPMIAIEVKFIETARDPRREFGVDWSGTLDAGGTYRHVDNVNADGTIDYTQEPTTGGYKVGAAPLLSSVNLNDIAGSLAWPSFSVLSGQDINVKLRALFRDNTTTTTSYPRMVTLNNREVAIRSVVNQPVLGTSSSASLGTGATSTASIAYLPIGTVLNILPKKMDDQKVLLNMAITVSTIVGTEVISGNPYPIASSRVYNAPVEVDSGYTVAVGGLDEAKESVGESGVPFVNKIPILSWAFKHRERSRNHKNLLLFITPSLIDAKDGGLPEDPQAVLPQRPRDELPSKPHIDGSTGALIGGASSLPNAVAFVQREFKTIKQTITEGRMTPEESKKLNELKTAVDHLKEQAEVIMLNDPSAGGAYQDLQTLNSDILHLRYDIFKKKYL